MSVLLNDYAVKVKRATHGEQKQDFVAQKVTVYHCFEQETNDLPKWPSLSGVSRVCVPWDVAQ